MLLKHLSRCTLFSRSSSQSPLSTFIAKCYSSCPSHPVSAWWDMENCRLPIDFPNTSKVSQYITAAVQSVGIRLGGPIEINAYGDVFRLKNTQVDELSSSGINLMHISPDGKSGADKCIQTGITSWAEQNPPPAHILLISGDKDFAQMLHRLRLDKYNIMLVSRETSDNHVHCSLKSAATVMWNWDSLLRDQSLIGRHYFNRLPSSSYGSYDGPPPEDPFSLVHRHVLTRVNTNVPEAFSQEDFWIEVEKFLKTHVGSILIAESISRRNLAFLLYNYGPEKPFKSLSESGVIHLVDALVVVKKWLIENRHPSSPNDRCYSLRKL